MKLRNKKTGEIGWLYCDHISVPKKMTVFSEEKDLSANHWDYTSLAELNEEWEDAPEEPKEYWFIDAFGNIVQNEITNHCGDEYTDMTNDYENQKQIGNYFETEEEAEEAAERLRAWESLKNIGYSFDGWNIESAGSEGDRLVIGLYIKDFTKCEDTLDLLFGGKE